MTDKKLKFKLVDAGCTEKDYRSRFIDENNIVTVTLKWSPEKSYYSVYPTITDSYRGYRLSFVLAANLQVSRPLWS